MKLTTKLTALFLLSTMTFATVAKSEEIIIPVISKPAVLQEGTQKDLTAAQIAELLPWAKDSKVFLLDLMNSTEGLSSSDKLDRLVEGLKSVVGESAPKNTELLMRYTINRGLVIVDVLNKETNADTAGTIDAKIRVLVLTIKMAIKYYDTDMATLSKKSAAPFVSYGLDYFAFLSELNKSIFDATAQYSIQRTSLEWLQWDLYRDLNNTTYSSQIVKINNSLKIFPMKKLSDSQALSYVRQIKSISAKLNFSSVPKEPGQIASTSPELTTISNPTLNDIPFSYDGESEGICKALGYSNGIKGSTTYTAYNDSTITASKDGSIRTGTSGGHITTSVICTSKKSESPLFRATMHTTPKIQGRDISYHASEIEACKLLGSEGAALGAKSITPNTEVLLMIDGRGNITGSNDGYQMLNLICIDKN